MTTKRYKTKELFLLQQECPWCGAHALSGNDCGQYLSGGGASRDDPCWFTFVEAAQDADATIKRLKRENKELKRVITG